jgi:DNA polymerase elongation subunit (family B)
MECGSEAKLFRAFQAYLKAIDPDIVSGWSVSQYDYPYLIKRAQTIGVSVSGLGRWGKPYTEYVKRKKKASWRSIIKGRSTIDMLEMFKKLMINKGQRESNALKEVSKDYGFEYVDYGAKLQRLFDDGGWDTFLQYCRNDVISLDLIDNHKDLKMYETYEYLRMISGTRLDDTLYNTKLIEMYSLHDGMKPMPTKHYNEDEEEEEKYEGAFVMLPPVGVHENVGAVDIASLYPTIMRAFPREASPDVDYKVIDVVNTFLTEREKYRQLRKDGDDSSKTAMVENAYKVLGNSVYGWVGSKSGRLFNEKCAEFITGTGRKINEYIRDCLLDKYGKKTLYGDTDSNFFEIVMSPEEGLEIQDNLNQDLIRWGNEHDAKVVFSLKFEKLFKTIMFKQSSGKKGVAKKKYCGRLLWEEGRVTDEFNSKGIELRRSDQARVTKTCLFKFLGLVLMETKVNEALNYVHEVYKSSLNGEIFYRDASIPKMIRSVGNKSPHARGIENTKTYYHYNIPDGVKPRLLYLKGSIKEICIDDEFELDPVTIENIDWEQMTESNITKKMKSYIESLGYKWDVVIHGQTSLDRWK